MVYSRISENNQLYLLDKDTQQKYRLATQLEHLQDTDIEAVDFRDQKLLEIPSAIFDCVDFRYKLQ